MVSALESNLMKPPEPPVNDGCIRLYHGTTDEAASSIMENGFEPLHVDELVGAVARRYDVSTDDILRTATPSFLVDARRVDGDDRISLHHKIIMAEFWARIGGEARWEALRSVYVLHHPEVDYGDPATWEWAEAEVSHVPTVVLIDVPYEEMRNRNPSMPSSLAEWNALPELFRSNGIVWMTLPMPVGWLVTALPVERTYDEAKLARLAGVRPGMIRLWTEEGELPPSDGLPWEPPIWWQSSVEPFLKAHGR